MAWAIKREKIRVGDVILLRSAGVQADLIAKATDGKFSHVVMVSDNHRVIEAIGTGVQVSSILRYRFTDQDKFLYLRPRFSSESELKTFTSKVLEIAIGHQSKGYDTVGAVQSLFKREFKNHDGKYFCSELVASIFREAGHPLFDKPDHHVLPSDFEKCARFTDISQEMRVEIPEGEDIYGLSDSTVSLDSGGTTSSEHAARTREFVEAVNALMLRKGLNGIDAADEIFDALFDPKNLHIAGSLDKMIRDLYDAKAINQHVALDLLKGGDYRWVFEVVKKVDETHGAAIPNLLHQLNIDLENMKKRYNRSRYLQGMMKSAFKKEGWRYAERRWIYYMIHKCGSENLIANIQFVIDLIDEMKLSK